MYIRSQQYTTPPAYSGITVPSVPPDSRGSRRPTPGGTGQNEAPAPHLPAALPGEKNSRPFYPVSDSFTAADFADRRKRAPLESQNEKQSSPRSGGKGDASAPPMRGEGQSSPRPDGKGDASAPSMRGEGQSSPRPGGKGDASAPSMREEPGRGLPIPSLFAAEDDLLLAALLLLMLREEHDGLPDDDMILLLAGLLLGR